MKFISFILIACAACLAPFSKAGAADAVASANIHLRAGPQNDYPIIATIRRGERIDLLGCIQGVEWCEVETSYRERGWVASYYLQTSYNNRAVSVIDSYGYGGGTNIIVFHQNDYWNRYYRDKYFYKDRARWQNHDRDDDDGRNHHHGNDDNDSAGNDDHSNGNGHHDNRDRPGRPVSAPQPSPHYQRMPQQPLPQPSKQKNFNPLCDIGQKTC